MTGDEFVGNVLAFLFLIVAICIPAFLATLIRKHFVQPDPNSNLTANIIFPPLIYLAGFLVIWAISIHRNWDGSKGLAHLIISPVHYPLWSTTYAALIGIATALFSLPLKREVKNYEHHYAIFCATQIFLMGTFIYLLYIDSEARHFFF